MPTLNTVPVFPFVVNTNVRTFVDSRQIDNANFGTNSSLPDYGGANEHWLAYSTTMLSQARRDHPNSDIYGHIRQEWSDGYISEWGRYSDTSPSTV